MNYLITIRIQDGERRYYDYFTLKGNSKEEVETEVLKSIEDSKNFETEEKLESINLINKKEYEVLQKFGII
jgi:hypothetical protein